MWTVCALSLLSNTNVSFLRNVNDKNTVHLYSSLTSVSIRVLLQLSGVLIDLLMTQWRPILVYIELKCLELEDLVVVDFILNVLVHVYFTV